MKKKRNALFLLWMASDANIERARDFVCWCLMKKNKINKRYIHAWLQLLPLLRRNGTVSCNTFFSFFFLARSVTNQLMRWRRAPGPTNGTLKLMDNVDKSSPSWATLKNVNVYYGTWIAKKITFFTFNKNIWQLFFQIDKWTVNRSFLLSRTKIKANNNGEKHNNHYFSLSHRRTNKCLLQLRI